MAGVSFANGSIDDLFRHKSLNEIRNILDQTTDEVEGKKRELRELVGDHYRNVLESADTIRAMSECVSKVSVGAVRVEELIASMRQLATNAPCALDPTPLRTAAAKARIVAGQDNEYQLTQRIMQLLEVPETVRGHLSSYEYALAARSALVDTVALQNEVSQLLQGGSEGIAPHNAFDFNALLQQQASTLRRLPRQIASSCVDAFSVVSLEPSSAAQSFVVHLLLDPSLPPADLLRRFLERRRQLLQRLLDNSVDGSSATCATRLASAAMAYEGTVVIAAALCQGSPGSEPPRLKKALMDMLEGLPQDVDEGFRRRVDSLGALLRHSNTGAITMCADLGQMGQAMAEEWAGSNSKPSLSSRFARLAASQASSATLRAVGSRASGRSCEALGCALKQCCEKVLSYRHTLGGGCASESWPVSWTSACQRFCPGGAPLRDALGCVTDAVEAACATVVRERVLELKLDLVFVDEDEDHVGDSQGTKDETTTISDAQRREEMRAIQEQSHLRVEHFNEQLAEILCDLNHVAREGLMPPSVTEALLSALFDRIQRACDATKLPDAEPLWRPRAGARTPFRAAAISHRSSAYQRAAARVAIVLAALSEAAESDSPRSPLRQTLETALSSGDAKLSAQARELAELLCTRSAEAYLVWARLALADLLNTTPVLDAFWRLSGDEVMPSCGWSKAVFMVVSKGEAKAETKAIPVPVQVSPFVSQSLALGASLAQELTIGSGRPPSLGLVTGLKAAMSEALIAAYEASPPAVPCPSAGPSRAGMCHYLQLLFDFNFLRVALSSTGGLESVKDCRSAAYRALLGQMEQIETAALSDPVDRTLYQPVMRVTVKSHIQEVKVFFGPYFLHNSLYGVLFPNQRPLGDSGAAVGEDGGFEIQQSAFSLPVRSTLPRFPLLPVAATVAYNNISSDGRLGVDVRGSGNTSVGGGSSAAVSALTQVGSALGSLGGFGSSLGSLGKGLPPLGGRSSGGLGGWSRLGSTTGGMKPPEAL